MGNARAQLLTCWPCRTHLLYMGLSEHASENVTPGNNVSLLGCPISRAGIFKGVPLEGNTSGSSWELAHHTRDVQGNSMSSASVPGLSAHSSATAPSLYLPSPQDFGHHTLALPAPGDKPGCTVQAYGVPNVNFIQNASPGTSRRRSYQPPCRSRPPNSASRRQHPCRLASYAATMPRSCDRACR